jgi:hypothetical protein
MKRIILVFGLFMASGFNLYQIPVANAATPATKASISSNLQPNSHDFNYSGTDEDGKKEDIKTGKPRRK